VISNTFYVYCNLTHIETSMAKWGHSGLFKSPLLPLPTLGKKGKGGVTPHPAKGRQPLGTLLGSTFKWPC